MMINRININPYIKFDLLQNKRQPVFCGLKQDVFEKRAEDVSVINSRINKHAAQRVPFGIEQPIKTFDLDYIKERTDKLPEEYKHAASETAFMAKLSKEMLDRKYGKDNYVFVSIGTSPAGIAKGLELMGQDVRYVPISSLSDIYEYRSNIDEIQKIFDPDKKYKNFLDSIGLNKDEIKKDKRHYVVADFTNEGTSLGTASLVADSCLGIRSNNVDYISINKELQNYTEKNYPESITQGRADNYIFRFFVLSHMERYAGIPHLHCKNLENIDNLLSKNKTIEEFNFEVALRHYLNGGEYEN